MESLKNLIIKETSNMFNDVFYDKISNEILKLMNKEHNNSGYIYFIKNGENSKTIKIGCAINIDNRVESYTTSFDKKIFIVGYIKCDNFFCIEKEIHSFFSDKKSRGEWFELNSYDFIDVRTNYDFKEINDYYSNKILIEKMNKKQNINLSSDDSIINFAQTLKKEKKYMPSDLFISFNKQYSNNKYTNVSWFGRELNKSFIYLGYKKTHSTNGGVRSFILHF